MTNMIHPYKFYSYKLIFLESYTLVYGERDQKEVINIKTTTSIIVDKFDQLLPQVLPSSNKDFNIIKFI